MSTIGQRVFVLGGNQLYMTLANEEFVRPLSIGSNWNKLRIGAMVAVTPDSTNNILAVSLTMGICSGTVNGFNATGTTNWAGVSISGPLGNQLTYNAGAGNPYFSCNFANYGKKVGASTTFVQAGNGSLAVAATTGSVQRRAPIFLDITKGSPNYQFLAYSPLYSSVNIDYSFLGFLDACEQTSTPVIGTGSSFTSSSSGGSPISVATSEVAGPLDTFSLFWSKSLFPLEVYGLAVYRQA